MMDARYIAALRATERQIAKQYRGYAATARELAVDYRQLAECQEERARELDASAALHEENASAPDIVERLTASGYFGPLQNTTLAPTA